jgi:hypothetical protein
MKIMGRHRERISYNARDRDWTGEGIYKTRSVNNSHQQLETRREAWNQFSLGAPIGGDPAETLISE